MVMDEGVCQCAKTVDKSASFIGLGSGVIGLNCAVHHIRMVGMQESGG